jgi:lysophospholipase L1-like esterase
MPLSLLIVLAMGLGLALFALSVVIPVALAMRRHFRTYKVVRCPVLGAGIRTDAQALVERGQQYGGSAMSNLARRIRVSLVAILAALGVSALPLARPASAELPWEFSQHTRYMALGDSLAAGYGAVPATQGYVYLLYQNGVFDRAPNTLLSNASVIGVTSQQVLAHQVPQACQAFQPTVVTLDVGGNDLVAIAGGADPQQVLNAFATNFAAILDTLQNCLSVGAAIYVANLYNPFPGSLEAEVIAQTANGIITAIAGVRGIPVADVFGAFAGRRGLLVSERHGAEAFEIHPTNAGHRAIAGAFKAVIPRH